MHTKKSWLALGLVGLAAGTAVIAWSTAARGAGQGTTGPAIGTPVAAVNLVRVLTDFEQTKTINQKMAAMDDDYRAEDQRKTAELENQKNAAKAFAPDSAEYKKQTDDLKKMMIEYQVWKAMEQDRITQIHLRWLNRTYKTVEDEVAKIAKARNIQLVITREDMDPNVPDPKVLLKLIDSRKVIYADKSVELTDEVLKSLNAAYDKAGGAKSIDLNK